MKSIKYLLVAFAALSLAACGEKPIVNPDPTPVEPETELPYTLQVTSNVPVSFNIDGKSYSGDAFIVSTDKKTGEKITVSAQADSKFISPKASKSVTLADEHTVAISFVFTRKPATIAIPDGAKIPVAKNNDVPAAVVNVPAAAVAAAVANGSVDADASGFGFAVVPETPANVEQVTPSAVVATEATSGMVVACYPDGADFGTEKVKITIQTPDCVGLDVECLHEDSKETVPVSLGTNEVSAEVSHFSNWIFRLKGKYSAASTTKVAVVENASTLVAGGVNYINCYPKYGYTIKKQGSSSNSVNALVKNELVNRIGASVSAPKSATGQTMPSVLSVEVTASGSLTYSVYQSVTTFTYTSGTSVYEITAYGDPVLEVVSLSADTSKHNGGQGR